MYDMSTSRRHVISNHSTTHFNSTTMMHRVGGKCVDDINKCISGIDAMQIRKFIVVTTSDRWAQQTNL